MRTLKIVSPAPEELVLPGRRYTTETLLLVHEEVVRGLEAQLQRVAHMQTRAGLLVGSSSVAAALVGSAANSLWWTVPIGLYLIAAVLGVAAVAPGTGSVVNPRKIAEAAGNLDPLNVRHEILKSTVREFEAYTTTLSRQRLWVTAGFIVFIIASGVLALVSSLPDLGH